MNIFINASRLSFLLLALSLTACGDDISQQTVNEGSTSDESINDDEPSNEDGNDVYEYEIAGTTLTATTPDGSVESDLTYAWRINGETVSENAMFDTATYSVIYPGEQIVTLATTDGDQTFVSSAKIDFGTGADYEFSLTDGILNATPPSNVNIDSFTYQWRMNGTTVSQEAAFNTLTTSYSGKQTVTLTIYTDTDTHVVSKLVDFGTKSTNQSPVANFTFSSNTLTATSTDDAGSDNLIHEWFADDQSIGNGSTLNTAELTGLTTIKLTSTDTDGLSDNTEKTIDFGTTTPSNSAPVAVATANKTSGDIPLTISFDGSASTDVDNDNLNYSWDFGDGTSSTLVKPTKTFDSAKNYTVTLTVTDSENVSNTANAINIAATAPEVDLPPTAVITKSNSSGTSPLAITFSGSNSTDDNNITSYNWHFGDGNATASGAETNYTYNAAGVYTVTLTVTDNAGKTTQATTQITVETIPDSKPVASFTMTTATGDAPFAASFNASGSTDDNQIASYSWDFGDNSTTASGITTIHNYQAAGTYTAVLTVTDNAGQTAQASTDIIVKAVTDLAPVASFTMDATTGDAPFTANFDASTSSDDNNIASYSWNFGDGNATASGVNTSYVYSTEGVYTAMLTVTDTAGQSTQITTQVIVTSEVDLAPIASFTTSATTGEAPFLASFDASASSDDNGSVSYSWNFGDNSDAVSGVKADHSYAAAGIYTVTLTVTDEAGQSTQSSTQITVTAVADSAPVASFSTSATTGEAPFLASFDASASSDDNGSLSYSWDFGDNGAAVSGVKVDHNYTTAGTYTVTLTVTDSAGQSTQETAQITVTTAADLAPVASFSTSATTGEAPFLASFDASASSDDNDSVSYSWNFGDNSAAVSGVKADHSYATAGTYTVTLTVTDSAGQSTQETTQIIATAAEDFAPTASFTMTTATGEAPFLASFDASGSSDDNNIASYSWDFGDNSAAASDVKTSHSYDTAGTFTAILTVTDNAGQSHKTGTTITVTAPIDDAPVASFTMNTTSGDAPLSTTFNATNSSDDNGITSYSWDFGDGSALATGVTAAHTYTLAGTFNATLLVTDTNNQTNSTSQTITIENGNVSESACTDATLDFCADFEDGTLPSDLTAAGNYEVADIGYNSNKSVKVSAGSQNFFKVTPPSSDFWARVFIRSEGDSNGYGFGGENEGFARAHGVLLKGTDGNAQMRVGDHRCQLEINRDGGQGHLGDDLEMTSGSYGDDNSVCNETFGARMNINEWYCLEVHFNGPESEVQVFWDNQNVQQLHVTADRTWTNEDKAPGGAYSATSDQPWGAYDFDLFQFGYESFNNNGAPANEFWYDDVAVSTQRIGCGASYATKATLDDSTKLQPTSNGFPYANNDDSVTTPVAAFTADVVSGTAPLPVFFDANTSSDETGITAYSWDFGDGSAIETGVTIDHIYTTAGSYTATLTVTNSSNEIHSITQKITVLASDVGSTNSAPTANFTVLNTGLSVSVDANDSSDPDGDTLSYAWEFIDGTGTTVATATSSTVVHGYATAGVKSITLTVTDSNGLTDETTQSITLVLDDSTEPSNGAGTIIFSEDYEDQTVGENPDGWGVNIAYNIQMNPSATQYANKVRVVDNAPGRDGKALYVDGTGLSSSQNYSIMPLDLSVVDNIERVYVRYYIYATTNYIGNRATTPSGAEPNHNHFMSLGVHQQAEMRIGEIKGALGANEYGADDIVPKDEYWYGRKETARMDAGTWYCIETAFINDGDSPILRTWLDDTLVTEIDEQSDWKNGSARANWLDGFFGGVQLGWGNFGTYDNELYFDDVVASNERIGCDASLTEPAPTLTPSFDIDEDAMVVMVDGSDSTGSADFTYEWDFDGESTDTTSGSSASYTFTTAGEKTISLTLTSARTTETITQVITIVDTTYDDLLASVVSSTLKHCIDCHAPSKNRPIVFESANESDIETGMIDYILSNSAQQLIDTPQGAGNHIDVLTSLNLSADNKQDFEDLVYLVEAKANGNNGSGSVGDGTILINENFESMDEGTLSSDWETWLPYSGSGNSINSSSYALVDSSMAYTGDHSLHVKVNGESTPHFAYQKIDKSTSPEAIYVRAYMYSSIEIGGGREGGYNEHVHWSALFQEKLQNGNSVVDDNNIDVRYGTWLGNIIGGFQAKNGDSSTTAKPTNTIYANDWTCFEYALIKNDTFDQMYGWLDDEEVFAATEANHWSNGAKTGFFDDATDYVSFGWRAFGSTGLTDIWFDDIVVSTDRIGCN